MLNYTKLLRHMDTIITVQNNIKYAFLSKYKIFYSFQCSKLSEFFSFAVQLLNSNFVLFVSFVDRVLLCILPDYKFADLSCLSFLSSGMNCVSHCDCTVQCSGRNRTAAPDWFNYSQHHLLWYPIPGDPLENVLHGIFSQGNFISTPLCLQLK